MKYKCRTLCVFVTFCIHFFSFFLSFNPFLTSFPIHWAYIPFKIRFVVVVVDVVVVVVGVWCKRQSIWHFKHSLKCIPNTSCLLVSFPSYAPTEWKKAHKFEWYIPCVCLPSLRSNVNEGKTLMIYLFGDLKRHYTNEHWHMTAPNGTFEINIEQLLHSFWVGFDNNNTEFRMQHDVKDMR